MIARHEGGALRLRLVRRVNSRAVYLFVVTCGVHICDNNTQPYLYIFVYIFVTTTRNPTCTYLCVYV